MHQSPVSRKAPTPVQGQRKTPPRLPDGAEYYAVYDAKAEQWTGFLEVDKQRIDGRARALFTLLQQLDARYRKSVKQKAVPA